MSGGNRSGADSVGDVAHALYHCVGAVAVLRIVQMGLRILHDLGHHLHSLHRVLAHGRLAGEHHCVRSVVNGVGHVSHLRSGRSGIADHGIQHLGCRDDDLAGFVALSDDGLLNVGNLLRRDFHAHVAAGHHNAVGRLDDLIQVLDSLCVLDLCDHSHLIVVIFQNLLDLPDGVRRSHKGCGDEIEAFLDTEKNVLFIFIRQSRQLDLYIRHVDALFGAQLAAVEHAAVDLGAFHLLHFQSDQTVVDQNPVARNHILVELLIVDVADLVICGNLLGGQHILLTFHQSHLLVIF